jgi:hypothetical protein
MSASEADMIRKYVKNSNLYLEYGSGGSTFNFGPLASKAISIEHNDAWCKTVQDAISRKYLADK